MFEALPFSRKKTKEAADHRAFTVEGDQDLKKAAAGQDDLMQKASGASAEPGEGMPTPQLQARDGQAGKDEWTLAEYARKCQSSEADVWQMLRRGELVGRTYRGRLYVSEHASPCELGRADAMPKVSAKMGARGELPPLPHLEGNPELASSPSWPTPRGDAHSEAQRSDHAPWPERKSAAPGEEACLPSGELSTASGVPSARGHELDVAPEPARVATEIALLVDHLSLAKEENREILRLTQDSMRRMSALTDTIVEMKNAVIEAKESEVLALRQQLAARDTQIQSLLQEKEDLEILARMLADPKP